LPEVTVRTATAADIDVLLRHRRRMWWDVGRRDEAVLELMQVAAGEFFATALVNGSYRGFLAVNETDEAVVGGGGVLISPWPGLPGQREARRATILNLYVESEHRRRGVARMLMVAMIAWCRENNFVRIDLHASDEGRGLYEQLGFKPTNEMSLELK